MSDSACLMDAWGLVAAGNDWHMVVEVAPIGSLKRFRCREKHCINAALINSFVCAEGMLIYSFLRALSVRSVHEAHEHLVMSDESVCFIAQLLKSC